MTYRPHHITSYGNAAMSPAVRDDHADSVHSSRTGLITHGNGR